DQKVCACCNNDLETHKENLEFVQLLKQNYNDLQSNEIARDILHIMKTKNNQSDKVKQEAIEQLKDYDYKESEIKDKEKIIEHVKKELGKKINKKLNLEQTKKALQDQIDNKNKINKDIAKLEIRLEDLKKQNEVLQNELDQIIKTNKNNMFER